jgi:very-short-patch-repair endonuclease
MTHRPSPAPDDAPQIVQDVRSGACTDAGAETGVSTPLRGVQRAPEASEAKRAILKAHRERHETALATVLHQAGLPEPEREYLWWPGRKFRADFSYPERRILIEVQGGSWGKGHSRADRYAEDRVRQAEAQMRGWVVIEVTPVMIEDGRALSLIERALKGAD